MGERIKFINNNSCVHEFVKLVECDGLCVKCGKIKNFPKHQLKLLPIHKEVLFNVRLENPVSFNRIVTSFFYTEMWRYIYEKRVFRVAVMGETRGGKSEMAQIIAINYARIFNKLYSIGHFDNVPVDIKKSKIRFNTDYIMANQSAYLYKIRDLAKNNNLNFGDIWIIDEDRDAIGGIGSYSEMIEISNINNIVAKYNQSEIWITPRKFLTRNTPYGIHVFIKDEKQRVNFGLLYKIEMLSGSLREQTLLGWTGFELHPFKKLRDDYENKKNEWIKSEISGSVNERVFERDKASKLLAEDDYFSEIKLTKNGNLKFCRSIEQQKAILEDYMIEDKIPPFNEVEIDRIVQKARIIIEKKEIKKNKK